MKIKSLKKRGFTLIEMLVAMIIVGILTSVSMPYYQKFQEKARYAKAQSFEAQLRRKMALSYDSYISFWLFNGDGNTLVDYSGQENHVPLLASVIRSDDTHNEDDGGALYFDGSDGLHIKGSTPLTKKQSNRVSMG